MTSSISFYLINRTVIRSLLLTLSLGATAPFMHSATAQRTAPPAELIQEFPVGNSPIGLAFDGANIWVSNQDDDTVMRLKSSHGAIQHTYLVERSPEGILFDGTSIWVANYYGNTVDKITRTP